MDGIIESAAAVAAEFGPRLRAARIAAGLTQTDLGREIGLPPSRISEWESGIGAPKWEYVLRVCAALKIPVSRLAK